MRHESDRNYNMAPFNPADPLPQVRNIMHTDKVYAHWTTVKLREYEDFGVYVVVGNLHGTQGGAEEERCIMAESPLTNKYRPVLGSTETYLANTEVVYLRDGQEFFSGDLGKNNQRTHHDSIISIPLLDKKI